MILLRLQESLLSIVGYILIFLVSLFVLLLVIYLVSIYTHARQNRYVAVKTAQWQSMVQSLLSGERSPNDFDIPRGDRKYFRDILAAEYAKQDAYFKSRIRDSYRQLGFYDDDIGQLKRRIWWGKIQAIERLGELKLDEAEEHILPLLTDKRSEVRFSALKVLALMGSKKLTDILPQIFADNTRWAYRYLVNKLFLAEIPADNLRPLASSPDRDLRKAAAILLGRQGNKEAIPILRNLATDDVKDVRREAIDSLGRIVSAETIPILLDRISDGEPQVRAKVARALGELKDTSTLSLVDKLASDPDFDVRFQAFFALERFGEAGKSIIRKHGSNYPEMAREFLRGGGNGNLD